MLSKQKITHVYTVNGHRRKKYTLKNAKILATAHASQNTPASEAEDIAARSHIQDILSEGTLIDFMEEHSEASYNTLDPQITNRHNTVRAQLQEMIRSSYSNMIWYFIGNTPKCIHTGCDEIGRFRCVSCTKGIRKPALGLIIIDSCHMLADANEVYCKEHLSQTHNGSRKGTHIFLKLKIEDSYAPSWRHEQLWDEITMPCRCSPPCFTQSAGKAIRLVSQLGQQRFRIHHSSCMTIHQTLIKIGYVAATTIKPELAFQIEMLADMRSLVMDCHVSSHNYCEHLRRASVTNGYGQTDANIYDNLRVFYPQFSAQMNARETFSTVPTEIQRTYCPACTESVHRTVTLTVDGNFSCKAKEHVCRNPQHSHWNHGKNEPKSPDGTDAYSSILCA